MLTLPLNTRLLSVSQNYSLFLSRMTKGKSPRGRHLIITRKASILILIITILISWSLWRRRWRGSETAKASLSTCYTSYMGVHLTHLISERVKASIHALKLCHDAWAYNNNFTKPNPKISRKKLKNPKNFEKPQNLGLKCMNAWKKRRLEHLPSVWS